MKTVITDTTLTDILVVCTSLPKEEIEQIEAFTGDTFDAEKVAVQLYNSNGLQWTCRVSATGEPLVVAGYVQVGASIWRSYMLANERAWKEYGGEVTHHAKEMVARVARGQEFIRLETICLASRRLAHRWYKRIGLTYESTLRCYGVKGENAVMYVKINRPEEDT